MRFGYFAAAYGVRVLPPGARHRERGLGCRHRARHPQIRAAGVRALFLENVTDPRLLEQIAARPEPCSAATLYSDALSPKGGPARQLYRDDAPQRAAIAAALQE